MFDSEAALKDGASDLGFDLSTGGLPHSRASSRLGKPQKLCLRLSSRQTLLLEPTVFQSHCSRVIGHRSSRSSRTSSGSISQTTSFPAQSMFENFAERLADGTLKAEPLSHVVTLFEEEQQDSKKPDPSRQYKLQIGL